MNKRIRAILLMLFCLTTMSCIAIAADYSHELADDIPALKSLKSLENSPWGGRNGLVKKQEAIPTIIWCFRGSEDGPKDAISKRLPTL